MIEHGLCLYLKKRKGISICSYIHQDMQFPFTFWVLFIDFYVHLQWSLLVHFSMTQNLIMEICRICFFLNISNALKALRLELIQHAFCKLNMLRSFSKNSFRFFKSKIVTKLCAQFFNSKTSYISMTSYFLIHSKGRLFLSSLWNTKNFLHKK